MPEGPEWEDPNALPLHRDLRRNFLSLVRRPALLFHPVGKRLRLRVRTSLYSRPWRPFRPGQGLWLPSPATPGCRPGWKASLAMQMTQPALRLRRYMTSSPRDPG